MDIDIFLEVNLAMTLVVFAMNTHLFNNTLSKRFVNDISFG
jgi:hypothetical protein